MIGQSWSQIVRVMCIVYGPWSNLKKSQEEIKSISRVSLPCLGFDTPLTSMSGKHSKTWLKAIKAEYWLKELEKSWQERTEDMLTWRENIIHFSRFSNLSPFEFHQLWERRPTTFDLTIDFSLSWGDKYNMNAASCKSKTARLSRLSSKSQDFDGATFDFSSIYRHRITATFPVFQILENCWELDDSHSLKS
jgi:hypothetical protein